MGGYRPRVSKPVGVAALCLIWLLSTSGTALPAAPTPTLSAVEGAPFAGNVASVTGIDCTPGCSAQIDWGDLTAASAGTVTGAGGGQDISGTHTYAEEGAFATSVTIVCPRCTAQTVAGRATVVDATLAVHATAFTGAAAQPISTTLASFSDADPGGAGSDHTAAVDWGDGTPAGVATVVPNPGGGFLVQGVHTFALAGSFAVTTRVTDAGGASAAATATAIVGGGGIGGPGTLLPVGPAPGVRGPSEAPALAAFGFGPEFPRAGTSVRFGAGGRSVGGAPPALYEWTFGDGAPIPHGLGSTSVRGAQPTRTGTVTHTFKHAGRYTVATVVRGANGDESEFFTPISISPPGPAAKPSGKGKNSERLDVRHPQHAPRRRPGRAREDDLAHHCG